MGRSQVLYNRTKGRYKNRPGSATLSSNSSVASHTARTGTTTRTSTNPGRGSGASRDTTRSSSPVRASSPARRKSPGRLRGKVVAPAPQPHPVAQSQKRKPKHDESILLLDHNQVKSYGNTGNASAFDEGQGSILDFDGVSSIDLASMAATLSTLSLSRRLNIPSYLVNEFESPTEDSKDDGQAFSDGESEGADVVPELPGEVSLEEETIPDEASTIMSLSVASPRHVSPRHQTSPQATVSSEIQSEALSPPNLGESPQKTPRESLMNIKKMIGLADEVDSSQNLRIDHTADTESFSIGPRTRVKVFADGSVEMKNKVTLNKNSMSSLLDGSDSDDSESRSSRKLLQASHSSRITENRKSTSGKPLAKWNLSLSDDDDDKYLVGSTSTSVNRSRSNSKGKPKGKKGEPEDEGALEDWLDDAMKSKSVDSSDGSSTTDVGPSRLVGPNPARASPAISAMSQSSGSRQSGTCWTVDSRGKMFESDHEEETITKPTGEDLDAWLDSVIN